MRFLYKEYYQKAKRGFTEKEFKAACEKMAGKPLDDFFEYTTTLKEADYPKYFGYAGLQIDTVSKELPGAWLGAALRERNDSLIVTRVDWPSPAWDAGIRRNDVVLAVNGLKLTQKAFEESLSLWKEGDKIKLLVAKGEEKKELTVELKIKKERSYRISILPERNALQKTILNGWLNN
jgi:predicted metalloprotease with PDZ domain